MRVYTEIGSSEKRLFPSAKPRMLIQVVRQAFFRRDMRRIYCGNGESPKKLGLRVVVSLWDIMLGMKSRRAPYGFLHRVRPKDFLLRGGLSAVRSFGISGFISKIEKSRYFIRKSTLVSQAGLKRTEVLLFREAKRSPRRRRLDPVFVFAKGFGSIEGGRPVFFARRRVKTRTSDAFRRRSSVQCFVFGGPVAKLVKAPDS